MKFRMLVLTLSVIASFSAILYAHGMKRKGLGAPELDRLLAHVETLNEELGTSIEFLGQEHPISLIYAEDYPYACDEFGNAFLHLIAQDDDESQDDVMMHRMIMWFLVWGTCRYFDTCFSNYINDQNVGKDEERYLSRWRENFKFTDPVISQEGLCDFIKNAHLITAVYLWDMLNDKNNDKQTPLEVAQNQNKDGKKAKFLAQVMSAFEARSDFEELSNYREEIVIIKSY